MVAKTKKTAKAKAKSPAKSKKMATKKVASKKAAAPVANKIVPSLKKAPVIKDTPTKSEMLNILSDMTSLPRKHVSVVISALTDLIGSSIRSKTAGKFVMPGVMKVMVVRKPATKARKGINPFTGEEVMFKAKPARNVVKIRPLKKLKDEVA